MSATSENTGEPTTKHKITDEASFLKVTSGRGPSDLYFFLQLDCLVPVAHQIACDFFRCPQLYTALGTQSTAEKLARLRSRYGSDERVPSQEQRDEIYLPIFGQSGTDPTTQQGDFPCLRNELLDAAAAFAERVFDTGEEMLRERVRSAHRPFQQFLLGLQGDSLDWSTDQAVTGVTRELAYDLFKDEGIRGRFGISTPAKAEWPFTEDANTDKLIEEISKQLLAWTNCHPITREDISNRQRLALRGTEALATILDFTEEAPISNLFNLIEVSYVWLGADVNRTRFSPPSAVKGLRDFAEQPASMS